MKGQEQSTPSWDLGAKTTGLYLPGTGDCTLEPLGALGPTCLTAIFEEDRLSLAVSDRLDAKGLESGF